ncbi:MAG: hypothetical protein U2P59_08135 [Synergistota bacterium]|nr:hypothetical protein [Synergistota bacterium]
MKRGRKSNAERDRMRLAVAKSERKKERYAERRVAGEEYFRRWIFSADKELLNIFCQLISMLNEEQKRLCSEGIQEQINRIQSR